MPKSPEEFPKSFSPVRGVAETVFVNGVATTVEDADMMGDGGEEKKDSCVPPLPTVTEMSSNVNSPPGEATNANNSAQVQNDGAMIPPAEGAMSNEYNNDIPLQGAGSTNNNARAYISPQNFSHALMQAAGPVSARDQAFGSSHNFTPNGTMEATGPVSTSGAQAFSSPQSFTPINTAAQSFHQRQTEIGGNVHDYSCPQNFADNRKAMQGTGPVSTNLTQTCTLQAAGSVSTNTQAFSSPQNSTPQPFHQEQAAIGGWGSNSMTNSASEANQPTPHDDQTRMMEEETERLQKEIEALKKLQKLRQQEEELKRWLAEHQGQGQQQQVQRQPSHEHYQPPPMRQPSYEHQSPYIQHSYEQSPYRQRSYEESQQQPFYEQQWVQQPPLPQLHEEEYNLSQGNSSSLMEYSSSEHSSAAASGLRQVKKGIYAKQRFSSRGTHSDVSDVEGQLGGDDKTNKPIPLGTKRLAAVTADTSAANVPVKILLNKIYIALMTDLDDETLQHEDTETILIVITLLKEAIMGILMAFLLVSVVLFVDHVFALRLPTARNFRKAAFSVMNDQETLRTFEENSGLKFLHQDEYDNILDEMARGANKTKLADSIFAQRSKDAIDLEAEMWDVKKKLEEAKSKLGLDLFCADCRWGMGMTCEKRVQALKTKYQTPKYLGMMSAMQKTSCRKSSDDGKNRDKIFKDVGKILNPD